MTGKDPNGAYETMSIASEPKTLPRLTVDKATWARVGRVTEPGRYIFTFGWLTITADDLAIWQAYPNAAFTLLQTLTPSTETEVEAVDEYRLGTFELRENPSLSEK